METVLSRRSRTTLIIAALLLHVSLLLFLAHHRFEFISKPALVFFDQDQEQLENTWAARKAHASAFGVPVSFEDPPPPQPPVETEKEQKEVPLEPQESQELVKPTQPEPTQQSIEKEEKAPEQTQITDAQPNEPASEIAPEPKEKDQNETQPERKKLDTPRPKKEPRNTQPMQQTMPNKKLTLAQLTQGFIEHLKNEGDSRITILGDENRQPTDEQLKHERYLERITWCLQKSYKINRHKYPPVRSDQTNMEIYLALNKNGSIHDLQIITSSGIKSLDDFALFIFRDASSEFPPLPSYLPQDPYAFVYVVQFISGTGSGFSMSMY